MSLRGHPSSRKQRETARREEEAEARRQLTAAASSSRVPSATSPELSDRDAPFPGPSATSPELSDRDAPLSGSSTISPGLSGQNAPVLVKRKYDTDFEEVERLYNAGDWHGAVEAAMHNLRDPTLPRWHQIRNHLMWAHAASFFDEAEEHRLIAERIYAETDRLTPKHRVLDRNALSVLRKELDELKRYQEEDLAEDEDLGGEEDKSSKAEQEKTKLVVEFPYRGKRAENRKRIEVEDLVGGQEKMDEPSKLVLDFPYRGQSAEDSKRIEGGGQ